MPVKYSFRATPQVIDSMEIAGAKLSNVLTHVTHLVCCAEDGELVSEVFSFKTPILLGELDPAKFIPEDQLDGATLLAWATAAVGQAEIDNLKQRAAAGLAVLKGGASRPGRELTVSG